MGAPHRAFEFLYLISEIIVIILYLTCTEYSTSTQGQDFFKDTVLESGDELWQEYADMWVNAIPVSCTEISEFDAIKQCMEKTDDSFSTGDTAR